MLRPVSIRAKFVRDLVLMVLLMGAAIVVVFWLANRRAIRTLSASIIHQTLQTIDQELQSFFEPITFSLQVAQSWGEEGDLTLESSGGPEADTALRQRLTDRFVPIMEQLPRLSSINVADETGHEYMLLHTEAGFEVWQSTVEADGTLVRHRTWSDHGADLIAARTDYDARKRPWYIGAIERFNATPASDDAKAVFWTEPYTFFTTGEPGITASVALRTSDGRMQVVGCDLLLRDISQFTRSLRVSKRGKVVVMTTDGLVVGLPDDVRFDDPEARKAAYLKGPEEIGLDLARDATNAFGNAVVDALKTHRDPEETTVRFRSVGEAWWGESRLFTLSPSRHLRMAVVVPEAELLGDLIFQRLVIAGTLIFVLLIGVWRAVALGRSLSKPVEQLVAETDRIGQGDLTAPPAIHTDISEVRRLAAAHDRMRTSLQSLMKLERDIQIARQIQQSGLPRVLPVLDGFEVDAWNKPADETGGDTFDVIGFSPGASGLLESAQHGKAPTLARAGAANSDRAILLLADATGHGIGPALAATQIRAMLRMAVRLGADLQHIAAQLNEQLVADLPENRFITAWLGEIDATTGRLTTFSAGQGPLLHYRAATRDVVQAPTDTPPFGVVPDLHIAPPTAIKMQRGDLFVVLSDGLFEARDSAGEQFGMERMTTLIAESAQRTATEVTAAVRKAIDDFTGYAPAEDDQTIIVIRRTG